MIRSSDIVIRHSVARDKRRHRKFRDSDVSYAAAETLGMVGGGIAKVKLDVVQ